MSKLLKIASVLSITSLSLLGILPAVTAHADNSVAKKVSPSVIGTVKIDLTFPAERTETLKNWLYDLRNQDGQKNPLDQANMNDKINTSFHNEGGLGHFTAGLPNADVIIGGQTIKTSNTGEFSLNLAPGQYSAQVVQFGRTLYNATINVSEGKNKMDIKLEQAIDQLLPTMQQNMDMSAFHAPVASNMETTNLVAPGGENNVVVDPGGGGTTYHGRTVPYPVGVGIGIMTVLTADGHVSCNKSAWDNGANFPNNSSDCSNAIGGGLIYLSDPSYYNIKYYDGSICVNEGMRAVAGDGGTNNPYCNYSANNGYNKPVNDYYHGYLNVGYNCSSFPFLNGDERLNKYNW